MFKNGAQNGQLVLFPTNQDLDNVLGMTDFHFQFLWGGLRDSIFPDSWVSGFLDALIPGVPDLLISTRAGGRWVWGGRD